MESTHTAVQQTTDGDTSHHAHICPHGRVKGGEERRRRSDFHKVALRPRHSPYPLLSVDDALKIVMASAECLGRTSVDGLQCEQRLSLMSVCEVFTVLVLALVW